MTCMYAQFSLPLITLHLPACLQLDLGREDTTQIHTFLTPAGVGKIYVLVRSKAGRTATERIER